MIYQLLRRPSKCCLLFPALTCTIIQSSSRPFGDSIDYENVATQFNRSYPEIGLKAHHAVLLMEIVVGSLRRSGVELSSRKAEASPLTTMDPYPSTHLASSKAPTLRIVMPNLTDTRHYLQRPGGYDVLAHKDFLVSATEAVSQCERPDFSEPSVCAVLVLVFGDLFRSPRLTVNSFNRRPFTLKVSPPVNTRTSL